MTTNNYLTEKDLAKRWRLSTATLQRWRRDNIGPSYIKMGCIRYTMESIEDFESKKKIKRRIKSEPISIPNQPLDNDLRGGIYA